MSNGNPLLKCHLPTSTCNNNASRPTCSLEPRLQARFSTVYASGRPPKVVCLLRDPSIRLWVAFNSYGQYPEHYGYGDVGFRAFFGNQSAFFIACAKAYGSQRCALRFEALGPAQAEVYYHNECASAPLTAPA